MKNLFLTILLLQPFFCFSQSAFEDTKVIIEHEDLLLREDLDTLLEVYNKYADFDNEEKKEVEVLLQFMSNPFGYELDYDNFFPESIAVLREEIVDNQNRKYTIKRIDYHLLLECDDRFPEDYEVFSMDDKVVLDDASLNCYQIKYFEKYPALANQITDEDGDGIIDMVDQEA
ncbi:MAG: hypothetical protein AAF573_10075, partial [Bacteroidota bacterium]